MKATITRLPRRPPKMRVDIGGDITHRLEDDHPYQIEADAFSPDRTLDDPVIEFEAQLFLIKRRAMSFAAWLDARGYGGGW